MRIHTIAVLLSLALSGCVVSPRLADVDLIDASTVINGIKCELNALYLTSSSTPTTPLALSPKLMSSIDLTLKVVASNEAKLNAKSVIPFTGFGLTPELSASSKEAVTITQTSSYLIAQIAMEALDCSKVKVSVNGMGLKDWLARNLDDQAAIVRGDPKVGLVTLGIESSFGITKSAGAGAAVALNFIPLTITPSLATTREDVQSLKIVFRGTAAPENSPKLDQYGPVIQVLPGKKARI